MTTADLQRAFPGLHEAALLERMVEQGREVRLGAGEEMMRPGQYIRTIPLVMEGRIRISRQDDKGGEVLLYFLSEGQTCAMSLSCCLADQKSSVHAVVEEDAWLLLLPVRFLDEWIGEFSSWKVFVLQTYGERFQELLHAFDAVAFLRMDERLLHYLSQRARAESSRQLNLSHQEIAQELHTSREVISRLLKRMENDGWLQLGRNRITLGEHMPELP